MFYLSVQKRFNHWRVYLNVVKIGRFFGFFHEGKLLYPPTVSPFIDTTIGMQYATARSSSSKQPIQLAYNDDDKDHSHCNLKQFNEWQNNRRLTKRHLLGNHP